MLPDERFAAACITAPLGVEGRLEHLQHDRAGDRAPPVSEVGWSGTTTATAIFGSLAGAKPIIQSATEVIGPVADLGGPRLHGHVERAREPVPAAVPEVATASISGMTWAAAAADRACFHTVRLIGLDHPALGVA